MHSIPKPIPRSKLRLKCGRIYYGAMRKLVWLSMFHKFSRVRREMPLEYLCFSHKTPLMRQLKDVDMWLQQNKVINLKLAAPKIHGILIRPGEIFSYWRLIGKPSRMKGYVKGMVLQDGSVSAGIGGGLCQLSNLIFWMAAHSPLTIVERHRHGSSKPMYSRYAIRHSTIQTGEIARSASTAPLISWPFTLIRITIASVPNINRKFSSFFV